MISIRCKNAKYLIFFIFLVFGSNIFAAGFFDSFREFIVDSDQSDGKLPKRHVVQLPGLGHSIQCMGCHDGSKASGVVLKHADTAMKFTGHGSANHPVGMNYREYATKDPVMFVSPEELDNRIILENGDVTCISCHSLEEPSTSSHEGMMKTSLATTQNQYLLNCTAKKNELTTGSNITTLCLSCHAM